MALARDVEGKYFMPPVHFFWESDLVGGKTHKSTRRSKLKLGELQWIITYVHLGGNTANNSRKSVGKVGFS